MAMPVSIGVPVFNGERYLALTLDSLLSQSFTDFELLLSDNASTDATEEICRSYSARDERVIYTRLGGNVGAAENYNRLVRSASGTYFKWAPHDDICQPRFLEACYEVLEAHPEATLAYPKTVLIDDVGSVVRPYEDRLDLRAASPCRRLKHLAWNCRLCNPCCGLIRREQLLSTGLIRPYASSDETLLGELALLGTFHEVPEQLFLRRIHPASTRQGGMTAGQANAWFSPTNRGWVLMPPRYRAAIGTVNAILRARLPRAQRARCVTTYAATFLARQLYRAASRRKRALRKWLQRRE